MSDTGTRNREVLELIKLTAEYFTNKGLPSPRVDAEILLAHLLKCRRLDLYIRFDSPIEESELDAYRELVRKRASGVPLQHLTGEQEFFSLKMQVSKKALIPRPETETLVELIIHDVIKETKPSDCRILEIGTGTGAIAIALAENLPACEIWATDLSLDALDVARGNAACHDLDTRIHFLLGDLFDPVPDKAAPFDMIVSNPPYIPSDDIMNLAREVREHEPHLALDGGPEGLDIIGRISLDAPAYMKEGARLFLETGSEQGGHVLDLLKGLGLYEDINIHRDLAGRERIVSARLMSNNE